LFKSSSSHLLRSLIDTTDQLYIVPAKWWRQWCDFINVEYNTYDKLTEDQLKQTHKHDSNICKSNISTVSHLADKTNNRNISIGDSMFVTNALVDRQYSTKMISPKISIPVNVKVENDIGTHSYLYTHYLSLVIY
jgi:hypothetical protein